VVPASPTPLEKWCPLTGSPSLARSFKPCYSPPGLIAVSSVSCAFHACPALSAGRRPCAALSPSAGLTASGANVTAHEPWLFVRLHSVVSPTPYVQVQMVLAAPALFFRHVEDCQSELFCLPLTSLIPARSGVLALFPFQAYRENRSIGGGWNVTLWKHACVLSSFSVTDLLPWSPPFQL